MRYGSGRKGADDGIQGLRKHNPPAAMTSITRRDALQAVRDGKVKHAHPFTWGVEADYLHVKPKTPQQLARKESHPGRCQFRRVLATSQVDGKWSR
jgi:hypothetical protein